MQSNSLHHYHKRKISSEKRRISSRKNKGVAMLDQIIYIAVFVAPVMNLPQLYNIWVNKSTQGVSFASWASFALLSCLWLFYGIVHREKPLIFMNSALIFLQAAIAVGSLIY